MPYAVASKEVRVVAEERKVTPAEGLLSLVLGLIPVIFVGSVTAYTSVVGRV